MEKGGSKDLLSLPFHRVAQELFVQFVTFTFQRTLIEFIIDDSHCLVHVFAKESRSFGLIYCAFLFVRPPNKYH